MQKYYVLSGIGAGFDGLVVQGEELDSMPGFVMVSRLIDPDVNVGDRPLALPVGAGAMLIGLGQLTETDDPILREFASNNPFGQLKHEGQMTSGNLKCAYAQFENVLQVSLLEVNPGFSEKTIFSQYFFKDFDVVKQAIEDTMKQKGDSDTEDLVFKLRALKEAETDGKA